MKRLKIQFIAFFFLFAATLGFLLLNSYRQMGIEERSIWVSLSESVFNQAQAAISDFLSREDERSFAEYRYYQAVPGQVQTENLAVSPLSAALPESDDGMIGYFQIDPDGSFSTPYLPTGPIFTPPENAERRKARENEIKSLTQSLRGEVFAELESKPAILPSGGGFPKAGGRVAMEEDLSNLDTYSFKMAEEDKKNIYPNPIQQQKLNPPKLKKGDIFKDGGDEKQQAEAVPQLARRKFSPSPVQSKAFEEQKLAPVKPEAAAAGSFLSAADLPMVAERTQVEAPSLLIDPFQARLVSDQYLVFYRKLWLNQKLYLQGFVVELKKFFDWAMYQSFANSDLMQFAKVQLNLGKSTLTQFGASELQGATQPLFQRALGYPLNRFELKILAAELPRLSARLYLNLFTAIIVLLATAGLYLIYRTAASQVKLSQKRQDFVSAVTHELKTPLTSIRMYSEMLEEGWVQDAAKRQEYYRHLSKESGRLSGLIDNVLQLARLEKQTYKLQLKRAVPAEDFEQWADELRKLAEARGFTLNAQCSKDLPEISYDPEAMKQVLLILLDNSLKFAAADKLLEMSLRNEPEAVVLEWSDRGPGIPKDQLKKVFEKFYRVENELTRRTQGTGIGLAMAKIIVVSMGAEIEAKNREGGGLSLRLLFQT